MSLIEASKFDNIVLFDLDGTLTSPRAVIHNEMVAELHNLSKRTIIGIVSGSPFSYIKEQARSLWDDAAGVDPRRLLIMPCNGTQLFIWNDTTRQYTIQYEADMRKFMKSHCGTRSYYNLVHDVLQLQLQFVKNYPDFLDLTGHFISYRKSMVNWAMVGRDAKMMERQAFVLLDKEQDVRKHLRNKLRTRLDKGGYTNIDLRLGGSTSIDIHPSGWDKTYALRHCNASNIWFVGDKCEPDGNDYSLYKLLQPLGRGFSTKSPEETIMIIREKILPAIS